MEKVKKYYLSDFIIVTCIFNLPIMYLDGLLSAKIGFDRFQTIYFLFIIMLTSLYLLTSREKMPHWLFIALYMLLIASVISTMSFSKFQGFFLNIQHLLRGPFFFAFLFLLLRNRITQRHLKLMTLVTLATVSTSTILHYIFSFGVTLKGGRTNLIFNGYLSDTNSAVLSVLILSLIYYHLLDSKIAKMILILVVMINAAALDSKSGILIVSVFILVRIYFRIFGRSLFSQFIFGLTIVVLVCLFLLFPEEVVYQILNFVYTLSVKGRDSLQFRLNTWDIVTILTATRNLKMAIAYEAYPLFTEFYTTAFGYSFAMYGEQKFVESDLVDTMFTLGLTGVIAILVLYFYPIVLSVVKYRSEIAIGVLLLISSTSTLTGHTLFAPASVVSLSFVIGFLLRFRSG